MQLVVGIAIGLAIGLAIGVCCPAVLVWIKAKYAEYKAKV